MNSQWLQWILSGLGSSSTTRKLQVSSTHSCDKGGTMKNAIISNWFWVDPVGPLFPCLVCTMHTIIESPTCYTPPVPLAKHLLLVTSCFRTAVGATLRRRCVGLVTLACGICGIFCLVRFGFSHELCHWQTGFPCADGVWCLARVQQHDIWQILAWSIRTVDKPKRKRTLTCLTCYTASHCWKW